MKSTKLQTGFRRWASLAMALVLAASLLCMGQPVVAQGLTQGDFQYQLTDDGVEITRYTGDSAQITIPETLEEQPVVGIGPAAFALNQTIEELTLPSTLEYIGDSAFLLCENLSRIEFSQSTPQVLQAGESILRNTAWWEVQPEGLVLLGGTALAEGRGEVLTPLPALPACWFVLCKPPFPVSTPELFRAVDGAKLRCHPDTRGMLDALERQDLSGVAQRLYNVFEDVLPPRKRAAVAEIRSQLLEHGALGACMSGTGPTVFGMFRDEADARRAERALRGQWPETWAVQNICP